MKALNFSIFLLVITTAAISQSSPLGNTQTANNLVAYRQQFWDSLPPRTGHTNDLEHLFTSKQATYLDSLITAFEKQDTMEIVIVTIDTNMVAKPKFDSLVYHIAEKWNLVKKKRKNSIVIAISHGYHCIRLNGYGIGNTLSGLDTKLLIDMDFIPLFRKNDYYGGTVNGLVELIKMLEKKN